MTEGKTRLDELLNDPMIKIVMASDGVRPEEIRVLLERARDRGEMRGFVPAAHVIDACKGMRLCA